VLSIGTFVDEEMALPNLNSGYLYFLYLEQADGFPEFKFYKIGYTKDNVGVSERIRGLKTGNPFTICELDSIQTPAAGYLERHLHDRYRASQYNLEWFQFESRKDIQDVIDYAKEKDSELREVIEVAKQLEDHVSNGKYIEATEETNSLYTQWCELERRRIIADEEKKTVEAKLKAETWTHGPLDGLTFFKTAGESRGTYNWDAIKSKYPTEYQECVRTIIVGSENYIAPDRPNRMDAEFNELRMSGNEVKKQTREAEAASSAHNDQPVYEASSEQLALYEDWQKKIKQLGSLKFKKAEITIRLIAACGENDGIKDLFEYPRIEDEKFDQSQFGRRYPEIKNQFSVLPKATSAGSISVSITKPKDS